MTCALIQSEPVFIGPSADEWYSRQDLEDIQSASTITSLLGVALRIIRRQEARWPIDILCGPMTTGGTGDLEVNLKVFRRALDLLRQEDYRLFNQMPFQPVLARLASALPHRHGYCGAILTEFYFPLFETALEEGYFRKAVFLPNWNTSHGARAERLYLRDRRAPIEEYPMHLWQAIGAWLSLENPTSSLPSEGS